MAHISFITHFETETSIPQIMRNMRYRASEKGEGCANYVAGALDLIEFQLENNVYPELIARAFLEVVWDGQGLGEIEQPQP